MKRDKSLSEADIALFKASVGAVKPLKQQPSVLSAPKPSPIPQQRLADEQRVIDELLDYSHDPAALETGEELLFRRAGLRHGDFKKLRRGQFAVQAELDLHGHTGEEAKRALASFLLRSQQCAYRCVRIIHGKGRGVENRPPVLKPLLDTWLRRRSEVLGFCSALPADGGAGAVYVLLKKRV